ncbi:MAG: Gfo/Idh/MocA family oxidoreductase [Chloroflexi bacterium]|nr:Gfo/Idh/MocA family oxidoreductase [Chloroflexota bacterium]
MIRVAIIGVGGIADTHIEAYLKFKPRCEIVGLVDIYPDKAAQKLAGYGLNAKVYGDHRALLDDVAFDLASVCLPPFAHAPITIDLLNADKHVLLEKPMAPSLQECDQMLAAAAANGKLLSIVAQNRFKTPTMKLKRIVESGIIGPIRHAQVDSFWWRGKSYYDLWWRGTWEKEGGGCTMNHAVHQIDLFHWVLGMPTALQAVVANIAHDNSEVEDFSTAILFYPDGSIGQINASLVHHGEPQQLVIQGECAMVAAPWRVKASTARDNGFPDDNPALQTEIQALYDQLPALEFEGHAGQIANVLGAIEGRAELLIDGQAGRSTIELVTAIYASSFSGQRIELPLATDNPFYTREGTLLHAPHFHAKTRSVDNFANDESRINAEGLTQCQTSHPK